MKAILGIAGAVLAGLIWVTPAGAAPATKPIGLHTQADGTTDVSAQRRRYRYYRSYPRYRYYRSYPRYGYAPGYYPYYRPYYRPGFYVGTPFFGFGF